jgi:hypothetical protein
MFFVTLCVLNEPTHQLDTNTIKFRIFLCRNVSLALRYGTILKVLCSLKLPVHPLLSFQRRHKKRPHNGGLSLF